MHIEALFIVRDPTTTSTLVDILWRVRLGPACPGLPRLDHIIRGSEPDAMLSERWTFYTEEQEATRDAARRMVTREGDQSDIPTWLAAHGLRLATKSEPGWFVAIDPAEGAAQADGAGPGKTSPPTPALTAMEAKILLRALHNDGEFLDGSHDIDAYLSLLAKVEQVFGVVVGTAVKSAPVT
jgi:hypothetical protein